MHATATRQAMAMDVNDEYVRAAAVTEKGKKEIRYLLGREGTDQDRHEEGDKAHGDKDNGRHSPHGV